MPTLFRFAVTHIRLFTAREYGINRLDLRVDRTVEVNASDYEELFKKVLDRVIPVLQSLCRSAYIWWVKTKAA